MLCSRKLPHPWLSTCASTHEHTQHTTQPLKAVLGVQSVLSAHLTKSSLLMSALLIVPCRPGFLSSPSSTSRYPIPVKLPSIVTSCVQHSAATVKIRRPIHIDPL